MNGHEQMRRKLWCDAAVACIASSNSTLKEELDRWADRALAEFDSRFKPSPEPTSTDDGWQPVETIPTSEEMVVVWWNNRVGSLIPNEKWNGEFAKSNGVTHWRRVAPPKEAAK